MSGAHVAEGEITNEKLQEIAGFQLAWKVALVTFEAFDLAI
jgi:hypothetical protein